MQGDEDSKAKMEAMRRRVAAEGGRGVVESRGVQHMAEIGRKGGLAISRDREHMARIGRKGGLGKKLPPPEQGA